MASQAGRRGFESRLPLHLFNEIADFIFPAVPRLPRKPHLPFDAAATAPASPSLFISSVSSFVTACRRLSLSVLVYVSIATPIVWPRWSAATFGSTRRSWLKLACVLLNTWKFTQRRPTGASFALMFRRKKLSRDRKVPRSDRNDSKVMAQAGLRSPQYLEIHPTQAHWGQFCLDVPPQEIVAGQKGAPFGRKYQRVVTDVHAKRSPCVDVGRKLRWNRRFSSAPIGFRIAAAAAVYPFNNLSNGTLDPCPPERKNLAWAHGHQACQSIYEPFPDIQHREPQVVLLFRHVTLLVPLRFFRRHQRARRVALY